jgi:hypothetical protein
MAVLDKGVGMTITKFPKLRKFKQFRRRCPFCGRRHDAKSYRLRVVGNRTMICFKMKAWQENMHN